jgi:hypothetical protein
LNSSREEKVHVTTGKHVKRKFGKPKGVGKLENYADIRVLFIKF